MRDFSTALGAAIGQAPSRELVEAQRGFDRATVRKVRRLVRRGEAAPDPQQARLAVAIAHDMQRRQRLSGTRTMVVFALILVAWAWLAVQQLTGGRPVLGVMFAVLALWGAYLLARLPVWRRNTDEAERLNRELLEGDEPHPETSAGGLARPSRPALAAGVAFALVFYTAGFGALTLAMAGEPLTVGRIVAHGAWFGVAMTVVNLTVMRRRNQRASRRVE
jgi:uncharacterized membrane protein (DUF485 family)